MSRIFSLCIFMHIRRVSARYLKRSRNNRFVCYFTLAFLFSRLSLITPHNYSSVHSSIRSLARARKNTEAARKGLFLIRWNYIDVPVPRCGGSDVLRAIDREMLERFDGKHRRINVRRPVCLDRGRFFDRRTLAIGDGTRIETAVVSAEYKKIPML